jgi:1-acyl-sn-glycerol-3-phosphate acyltransferase
MIVLRSALFNAVFFAVSFVLTLVASVTRIVAPNRILDVAMLWARLLVVMVRVICGIRLEVGVDRLAPSVGIRYLRLADPAAALLLRVQR